MSRIFKVAGVPATPFVLERLCPLKAVGPGAAGIHESGGGADKNVGGNIVAIEKEAYERGFAAGEKAGFELGRQKADVLFSGIAKVLDRLSTLKKSLCAPCEKEMVELTIAISKKVIQRELEIKKETVLECVKAALKSVVAGGEITIKANPKDLAVLLQYKGEIAKYGDGVKGVKLEADESVARGGCLIDTNFGEIDASMDSVMAEIEEKLKSGY